MVLVHELKVGSVFSTRSTGANIGVWYGVDSLISLDPVSFLNVETLETQKQVDEDNICVYILAGIHGSNNHLVQNTEHLRDN